MSEQTTGTVVGAAPTGTGVVLGGASQAPVSEGAALNAASLPAEVVELMQKEGVTAEVAAAMLHQRQFLLTRSGMTLADMPDDGDAYYITTQLKTFSMQPRMEIIDGPLDGNGKPTKVRQPKLDDNGEPLLQKKTGFSTINLGDPDSAGTSWDAVNEAGLDLLTTLLTGKLYDGMWKNAQANFRPGEFIKLGDLMRFFDVASLQELVAMLAPKYKPKLNASDKQKAALQMCITGDEEVITPIHEWLNDKLYQNLHYTLSKGGKVAITTAQDKKLRTITAFAANYAISGAMKGKKPSSADFGNWLPILISTSNRLRKNLSRAVQAATANGEDVAAVEAKFALAIDSMELLACTSNKLSAVLVQFEARAAAKAAEKRTEAGEEDEAGVDPLDLL